MFWVVNVVLFSDSHSRLWSTGASPSLDCAERKKREKNLCSLINPTIIKSELREVKLSSCRTPRSEDGSFSKPQVLLQHRNAVFLCALHKHNSSTGTRSGQTRENGWDELSEHSSLVWCASVSGNQQEPLKRSNKRFKLSTIGIADQPNCSYQSFLLLPESLNKSSKVTTRHKSHFRDARCQWASSPCKTVTFYSQNIITEETRAGKAGPIPAKPRVVCSDIIATRWAKKPEKKKKNYYWMWTVYLLKWPQSLL